MAASAYLREVLPLETPLLAHRAMATARSGTLLPLASVEPWRTGVERLTGALTSELERLDAEPPPLGPRCPPGAELLAFAAEEVSRRRQEGTALGSVLSLMLSYRQAYLEVMRSRRLDQRLKEECSYRIERFFRRLEIALCEAWTRASAEHPFEAPKPTRRDVGQDAKPYLTIFENLPEPVFVVGDGRSVTEWNLAAAVKIGGASSSTPLTAADGERPGWLERIAPPLLELQGPSPRSIVLITAMGTRTFEATVGRLGEGGQYGPARYVMLRDLSDHLLAQQLAAEKRNLELERDHKAEIARRLRAFHTDLVETEKMSSLGQIAQGLAKELHSPVVWLRESLAELERYCETTAPILLAAAKTSPALKAQLDALPSDPDQVRELLEDTREGWHLMHGIVQRLSTFAEAEIVPQAHGHVDLRRVLDDAVLLAASALVLRAEVKLELEPLPPVRGSSGQLGKALVTMLVHAAQSIDGRGVVTVRAHAIEGGACVEVRDTGRGIAAEALPRIFEPFFGARPGGDGAGLDLAAAWAVAKAHGGHLTAESTPGQGTVMRLWVPAVHQ